jgi:hypothetical protein
MNRTFAIITFLLAVAALSITLLKGGSRRPAPVSEPTDSTISSALARELEGLRQDQRALRESVGALERRLAESVAKGGTNPGQSADLASLHHRLSAVEAQQTGLVQQIRGYDRYGLVSAMEKELVEAYQTVLDESQPLKVRLSQADRLKKFGHFDERAAEAVMSLFNQSENLEEKAAALQALAGAVRTPQFRDQVLASLNADLEAGYQSARYRYHAIEALEPMLPDPLVRQWLEHLARHDPEYKIATRAGQPLGITPPPPPEPEKK